MTSPVPTLSAQELSASPIFVCGVARSGTSALLQAILRHPEVSPHQVGEGPLVDRLCDFITEYWCGQDKDYHRANTVLSEEEWFGLFRSLCLISHYGTERPPIASKKRYWAIKIVPQKEENLSTLQKLFPNMRMLILIRNGIESVNSSLLYPPFSHMSFEETCVRWAQVNWNMRYLQRYEFAYFTEHGGLVRNPTAVLRRAFRALGIPDHQESAAYLSEHVVESSFPIQSSPRDHLRGRAGKIWKEWSPNQRRIFEEICRHTMEYYKFWKRAGP